jgi:uncharacterized protein (TIGR02145 family)
LGANNESGFTALPGGFRSRGDGNFLYNKYYAFFWSSTEVWFRLLTIGNERVDKNDDFSNGTKSAGISVRCIKDTISFVTLPTLTTTDITAITTSSATSGGNIAADGGSSITARGVVWATTSNPTISLTTKTSDGTGTGSFTSDLTNLTTKTTYYVRAYATNSAGSGYGNEISFTTLDSSKVMNIPCLGTPTVKDIDGNTYNTVQIGTQCWMKENLKVSRYKNGDAIPIVTDNTTWNNLSTGARCWYDNDSISYEEPYGNLYNWYATSDSRGICPTGWHVPTDAEWTTLTTYLGGESVAGGKMKSVGTTFWNSPNTGATNESSFSALPGSFRSFDGNYSHKSIFAFFWSTTVSGNMYSWGHPLPRQ